ncbi:379_t:CDS:2, partial [Dentiscutata erythropus]
SQNNEDNNIVDLLESQNNEDNDVVDDSLNKNQNLLFKKWYKAEFVSLRQCDQKKSNSW